ncbi:hypothetical protein HUA74_34315 [Myxococcus sp. CA051A]|uniref:Uncharacterized protein n=1 Tax=Myxococcus llanfairpwllgwyngyllgogerychwyrndrobwllllantysiliogogogochensis TaxID=2590453 RepID=A0A540WHW2_9BACT|nr:MULTISPECIES: hypothetical protein [Myxococcus]NTX03426.1 hypothetical protein [Myxococcus sp. CA040A]NTX11832.1 hypothetical protein [Myxococcus sp. CA056]NTX34066.1 hypothetical protein [Myxococcus sp. CA033]NTX56486.1 hypothetical protein [Myxococcus sp. CA039A]NTX65747.1 hypothetical protein [Myxococcus sp. CA051A]
MRLLTVDALVVCAHELGRVGLVNSQPWVTVERRPLLVRADPEGRPIGGCPNIGPTIKPCTTTLKVQQGYSTLVTIDGKPVCLDTLTGLTDGTPPGIVKYKVNAPGQMLVTEER